MTWSLPEAAEIGGKTYTIYTDYRDILDIIRLLQSETDGQQALVTALALFYEEFPDMPVVDYTEAWNYLRDFISCGEADDGRMHPKLIDWEQDGSIIAAEINKVAHMEVRSVPEMHWFTFIGYFHGIGEGQLSSIVSIRQKKSKGKKLEKWEREFYQENKAKIDFKTNLTDEEQAEIDRINALLGD